MELTDLGRRITETTFVSFAQASEVFFHKKDRVFLIRIFLCTLNRRANKFEQKKLIGDFFFDNSNRDIFSTRNKLHSLFLCERIGQMAN